MTTLNDDDRRLLSESINRFAAESYDFERRQAILREGAAFDRGAWHSVAEMGLLGLAVPETRGGAGGGMRDLGVLMHAVGHSIMLEPYLSTAVVGLPLLTAIDPEGESIDIAPAMAGEEILAFAHFEEDQGYTLDQLTTHAVEANGEWKLHGAKGPVMDGPIADVLLVTANLSGGGVGLFAVAPRDVTSLDARRTVDDRRLATLRLDGTTARRIGKQDASEAIADAIDRANIALGYEAIAGLERLVGETNEYVKTRRAFGSTLAQFQVIRHRIVDMFVQVEEAKAIVDAAARAYDGNAEDRQLLCAAAKTFVARAARFGAENAVQLHGGIGTTDELSISHFFKRMMMIEALYGDAEVHFARYVEQLPPFAERIDL
jgi:alkylation response protein AidB-like acyl-CoA dehydrogenase